MFILLIFVTVYFWMVMGPFGLVAMLICSGSVYVSIYINGEVKKLDAERRPLLDKKSKIISDSILSIKSIKFNAWEELIRDKLHGVRKEDNKLLQNNFTLQGVSAALVAMIPCFTGLFCIAYVKMVLGKEIRVETIYAILLYLNYLKKQMIFSNLAYIIINSCIISVQRIQTFLRVESIVDYHENEVMSDRGWEGSNRDSLREDLESWGDSAVSFDRCSMS